MSGSLFPLRSNEQEDLHSMAHIFKARGIATILVIVAVALLTPAAASAGTFRWQTDGNGFWTDPANWQHLSGPVGSGFPNGRDDVAVFSFSISAERVVRIPSGISITIGTLQIAESFALLIEGQGTTTPGKLIFDSSAASATLDIIGNQLLIHEIRAPVDLRSDLTVDVFSSEGTVSFQRPITQVGLVPRGVKKKGHGRARFTSPTANNYEGTTIVEEGMLDIFQSNTILAIPGDLEIGLADGDSPAELQVTNGSDVIRLGSRVRVLATGTFDVRTTSQSIASLTMSGGFATIGHISATGGFLSAGSLTMTGGTLNIGTDTARYRLDGPATVTSSATQSAVIMGTGDLLLNGTGTFNVLDGPLEQDLLMNAAIIDNSLNYGLTKTGAGTMRFTGPHQNGYIGATTVQEGRLDLARTSVATTIRGSLIVGGAGRQAEVAILQSGTIQDNSPVSVLPGGVLTMTNASDRIGSLTMNEATATITEGTLTTAGLSMTGATLQLVDDGALFLDVVAVAATSTPGRTSVIGGNGIVSLNGAQRTFVVADGPEAIDLRIDAGIRGTGAEGLTKTQPGVALITGRNEYDGNTAINGGTLIVTGLIQASVSVANNATLAGTGAVGDIVAQSASTVSPGLSPGRLRSEALSLHPGSRFVVELLGPTAGTDYDQVRVEGNAEVQGCQLTLVAGPQLSPFGQFMLIDNDGTDPIAGAFDGLLEGATVRAQNGREFTISYTGGDGNDVGRRAFVFPRRRRDRRLLRRGRADRESQHGGRARHRHVSAGRRQRARTQLHDRERIAADDPR
jgi:autotransporter-associated beta strand protein